MSWSSLKVFVRNCVLYGRLLSLKQDKTHLHYRVAPPITIPTATVKDESKPCNDDDTEALLKHYFSMKHDCK